MLWPKTILRKTLHKVSDNKVSISYDKLDAPQGGAMRFCLILSVMMVVGCATSPPESVSTPSPQERNVNKSYDIEYYDITGSSAKELKAQIVELGPEGADSSNQWRVKWFYDFALVEAGCTSGPTVVDVTVTHIFPDWVDMEGASQDLIDDWNKYLEALHEHGEFHREVGYNAGDMIWDAITTVHPNSSCSVVEETIDVAVNTIIEEQQQKDSAYDAETEGGLTQGAVWLP